MPDTRKIIKNAYILSCDKEGNGGRGTVTIRNDRIVSVTYGAARNETPAPDVEVMDGTGKILLPGFVDLHIHSESIILDLLTEGEPQQRWQRLDPFSKAEAFWNEEAGREDWRKLYTLAYFLALRSGVTFLGEFGVAGGEETAAASLEAFRRTELPGMLTLHNADQLETARRENVKGVSFGLSLPPAEELTTYNLQASLRLSRDAGYPLVAHLGETTKDAEFVFRNFRKGTVQILEEFGIFESGCLLLHGGITDAADIERLKQRGISPVIAPGSALRKGIDPPRSDLLRSHNIATAICTDWGPFLHWNAIRTAQTIASHQGAPPYSGLELLRALTARPAELVDMSSEFGTISPGKRANLQLVKCRNLELQAGLEILPPESVAQMMIQRTATSDVSDVMVNGEFNVREGTILTYSEDDILGDAQSLLARSGAPGRVHTSTQLVEIDTPESTEDHDDGLGDEGFRILKKGDRSLAPATILPLEPSRDGERDLPKSVRRIFGEDEL